LQFRLFASSSLANPGLSLGLEPSAGDLELLGLMGRSSMSKERDGIIFLVAA